MLPALTLKPGPVLEFSFEGAVAQDVTCRAAEFLFAPVRMQDGVTLADLFGLLGKAPLLLTVFRRDFAQELYEHVRECLPAPAVGEYAPDGIEYLELYQQWRFDTDSHVLAPRRISLHGVGFELREDWADSDCVHPKGTRIEWGVSLTDVRQLLSLPIRIRESVQVVEDDLDAHRHGLEIFKLKVPANTLTLSDVLHAVLWELSFYGAPEEQAEVARSITGRVEEAVEASLESFTSSDDFFESLYRPGIDALFESVGEVPASRVSLYLREVLDDEPVQAGLDRVLSEAGVSPCLRVLPEHRLTEGRPFRRLFRVVQGKAFRESREAKRDHTQAPGSADPTKET